MKYAETLFLNTDPSLHNHNIDYIHLKHLLKTLTTPQPSSNAAESFLPPLLASLQSPTNLLTSRTHEIIARLNTLTRAYATSSHKLSRHRCQRLISETTSLLSQLTTLETFRDANKTAILKLLKKFRRWTNPTLSSNLEYGLSPAWNSPNIFYKHDFSSLRHKAERLLRRLEDHRTREDGAIEGVSRGDPQNRHLDPDTSLPSTRASSARASARHSPLRRTASTTNTAPLWLGTARGWNEFEHASETSDDDVIGEEGDKMLLSYGAIDSRPKGWGRGDEEEGWKVNDYDRDESKGCCLKFIGAPLLSLMVTSVLWGTPLVGMGSDVAELCVAVLITVSIVLSFVGAWGVLLGSMGMGWVGRGILAVLVCAAWIAVAIVARSVGG